MIRLAAIGTASTGKSAVLNALFGSKFPVDARAETNGADRTAAIEYEGTEILLIDTAPLETVSTRAGADAYLLVCDKDLTDLEYQQMVRVSASRPAGVAVNKSDTYSRAQMRQLLQQIRRRLDHIVPRDRIVACAADPVRITYRKTPDGHSVEEVSAAQHDVHDLRSVVRDLISDAELSLRVRTRAIAKQGREAAANWLRGFRISEWQR
jgi:predicted GTPase